LIDAGQTIRAIFDAVTIQQQRSWQRRIKLVVASSFLSHFAVVPSRTSDWFMASFAVMRNSVAIGHSGHRSCRSNRAR